MDYTDIDFTIPEVKANDYLQELRDYIATSDNETITADELVWLFNDLVKKVK